MTPEQRKTRLKELDIERQELLADEHRIADNELKGLIGKCYVSTVVNGFKCYYRVMKVNEDVTSGLVLHYHTESSSHVHLFTDRTFYIDNMREITQTEFYDAWRVVLDNLNSLQLSPATPE